MKILVTGGAGFIGSNTVRHLVSAGMEVAVVDNFRTGRLENLLDIFQSIRCYVGDICDSAWLREVVAEWNPEAILHLAAIPSETVSFAQPLESHRVNLTGALSVLEASSRGGVKRVVLASSASVYGDPEEVPIKEDIPLCPKSPYAVQKHAMEQYAQVFHQAYETEIVALRYMNVFGPRDNPNSDYSGVISIFLSELSKGGMPAIHGDGTQTRDFVYVRDVAEVNRRSLLAPLSDGWMVMNVGTGRGPSIRELYGQIQSLVGAKGEPAYGPARHGDIRRSCADISRLRLCLRFEPSWTLERGLEELITWRMG